MDYFDDLSIEEFSSFDFVEEMNEPLEEEEKFNLQEYLNSNIDYWLCKSQLSISLAMP